MLALEPIRLLHVVAEPVALDTARWFDDDAILRTAPDEALVLGASAVLVDDPDAIVTDDVGFSAAILDEAGLERVLAHVEFPLPADRPALVQGKVAGVPAKLLLRDGSAPSLLVVQTAYAADLEARLR